MKIIIYISLILLILTSCQKDKFTSCESYDSLVGEWISVEEDNGTKDRIKLSENGIYEYISAFGRGSKKRLVLCDEYGLSSPGSNWKSMTLVSNEQLGTYLLFTFDFDSILVSASAYNGAAGVNTKSFIRK